VKMAGPV